MLGIAGHEVMRCGSLRAFQKYVVVWVGADAHPLGGLYPNAAIADCAQYGCNFAIASIKPGAADDLFVFRKKYSRLRTVACWGPEWSSEIPALVVLAD